LKAFHHIIVSSAETTGTFNTGFDTVNLHRPTMQSLQPQGPSVQGRNLDLKAKLQSSFSYSGFKR